MNQTVVVFGGSGFIGRHLLASLALRSDLKLVSFDRKRPVQPIDDVDYVQGDIRDLSSLSVKGQISCIYNLAAVHTTPGHQTHEYYDTNIRGAVQVTAFARRHNVSEIVFTSSISVYGPSEDRKDETTPPSPSSAYGWSKWLSEEVHRSWFDEAPNRRLVIVRPAVIFGPGEGGNFTRLASLMRRGLFLYPGRTDTIKACFYVDDLIDAILFAQSEPDRYILFNGCYPDRYAISDIVNALSNPYFSAARTAVLPSSVLMAAAQLLRPLSVTGLGIHPERITKLLRSTDIVPEWLQSRGHAPTGRLHSALSRWNTASEGKFD